MVEIFISDYYEVLGLTSAATTDELKAAYINLGEYLSFILYICVLYEILLALLHHPDSAHKKDIQNIVHEDEFIKINEAWSILSKPELKTYYDSMRLNHFGSRKGFHDMSESVSSGDSTAIADVYHAQKVNFATNVQFRASSNWRELQDKYKTEKWQNMTLNQRKVSYLGSNFHMNLFFVLGQPSETNYQRTWFIDWNYYSFCILWCRSLWIDKEFVNCLLRLFCVFCVQIVLSGPLGLYLYVVICCFDLRHKTCS